jgi:hypothetical protein
MRNTARIQFFRVHKMIDSLDRNHGLNKSVKKLLCDL